MAISRRTFANAILAMVFVIAGPDGGIAMQNPIYAGINRIELSCVEGGGTSEALCEELQKAMAAKTGLAVGRTTAPLPVDPKQLGVLRVSLESGLQGDGHWYQIVWENAAKRKGVTGRIAGERIIISSTPDGNDAIPSIVARLMTTLP